MISDLTRHEFVAVAGSVAGVAAVTPNIAVAALPDATPIVTVREIMEALHSSLCRAFASEVLSTYEYPYVQGSAYVKEAGRFRKTLDGVTAYADELNDRKLSFDARVCYYHWLGEAIDSSGIVRIYNPAQKKIGPGFDRLLAQLKTVCAIPKDILELRDLVGVIHPTNVNGAALG